MHNLADIEARCDEIKVRINQILKEISKGPVEGQNDVWTSLTEEMVCLIVEAKALDSSLINARETAAHLLMCPCSGPH